MNEVFDQDAPENTDRYLKPKKEEVKFGKWVSGASHELLPDSIIDVLLSRPNSNASRISAISSDSDADSAEKWTMIVANSFPFEAFGYLLPKIAPHSEDAPPLLVSATDGKNMRIVLGVFDGMGGAGSTRAVFADPTQTPEGDHIECSQAYFASRVIRNIVQHHVLSSGVNLKIDKSFLETNCKGLLQNLNIKLGLDKQSRLKGKMQRTLPTTAAIARVELEQGGKVAQVECHWAGDSRIYLLTPEFGLQQLTTDDVDVSDALQQLQSDPPVSAIISASDDCTLNSLVLKVPYPFILIAATDGIFGYIKTPGILELKLLESLRLDRASTVSALLEQVATYTSDDASLVATCIGFENRATLNLEFKERLLLLRRRYERLESGLSNEDEIEEIAKLWNIEKPLYSMRMRSSR
jgi:serine/threonine protein phosphatase PrpC